MANSQAGAKDRWGWQAKRINRRNLDSRRKRVDQEKEERRMPGASQPHSQPWSKTERKTHRIKKGRSPEAKQSYKKNETKQKPPESFKLEKLARNKPN